MEDRIQALLEALTLEEKAALCAGSSMWLTTGIPRLGIPAIKVSDGPIGVRGGNLPARDASACFPNASALGATWSPELVERMGVALGEEAKTKGVHVVLGPTVNLHRSPLGGRHFEAYSEDPLLTARLCVAFVKGVQRQGVGTSVKHLVCNDSEFERMSISSEVDERTLREVYLRPFEAAVQEAGPWTIMAAYNQLNGSFCTANRELLVGILEKEWGYDGVVVSDWFALKDTEGSAYSGLDLEMPGPPRFFGEALVVAVKDGRIPESEVDRKVRRVLRLIERSGAAEGDVDEPEQAVDRPEHRSLARRLATEAAVLLRNQAGVLPLSRQDLRRIAVIGPNAAVTSALGGGSAQVRPHYETHALDAIRAAAGGAVDVVYEPGCTSHKTVPALESDRVTTPAGSAGFELEIFDGLDLEGEPVQVRRPCGGEHVWIGEVAPGVPSTSFSARLRGRFTPKGDGPQTFALGCAGRARLLVDGTEVIDQWTAQEPGDAWLGRGAKEKSVDLSLEVGRPVELVVEFSSRGVGAVEGIGLAAVKLGHMLAVPEDAMQRAVDAARAADAAVVVVGLNAEWETEGCDKADMRLPGQQAELVEQVAAVNPNTIVVVNAGAPLEMEWAERVPGVLWAWYGGQEAGNAIADLLFGDANPGGRLPTTFPVRLEDNAAHTGAPLTYPGQDGRVEYREGVFVGHRHYDREGIAPRFPFGFGLSYTTFEYGEARLEGEPGSDDFAVVVDVRNTGDTAGSEVVQGYLRDAESSVPRPEQELAAFAKLEIAPGESRSVKLPIPPRALCFWNVERRAWTAEPGAFELRIARSSRDVQRSLTFALEAPLEV